MDNLFEITMAMTVCIVSASKNHGLDSVKLLNRMSKTSFKRSFSSYSRAKSLPLSRVEARGWVDVYSEFSFAKLGRQNDMDLHQDHLKKFVQSVTGPLRAKAFLKLLWKHKVYILNGKLMQLMVLAVYRSLGFVEDDEEFRTYLPPSLTKNVGSAKLLKSVGLEHPDNIRCYIQDFTKEHCIAALVYENVLCKFYVGYFRRLPRVEVIAS